MAFRVSPGVTVTEKDFTNVIEKSFGGKLSTEIFKNPESYKIFMTTCKRATIAISTNYKIAYMDKFGVIPEAKGEGLGSAIFHEMRKEYPQVFWRSKNNNPINKFYFSIADGYQKTKDWDETLQVYTLKVVQCHVQGSMYGLWRR